MAPRQRVSSNQSLVNIQNERKIEKPDLAAEKADNAREAHDFFNLIALIIVLASTIIDWDLSKLPKGGPTMAYSGQHFWLNWATTILYFITDLIWVSLVPICVKSPGMIVKHHIVAIAYLSAPVVWPEYRWFMGACLSVEVNTWFLIARRVVYKRQDTLPKLIPILVSQAMYISWIIIRVFIYPAILVQFLLMAKQAIDETQQIFHWPMIFIPVHLILCLLNLKWTYDLFKPIITGLFNNGQTQIAQGL